MRERRCRKTMRLPLRGIGRLQIKAMRLPKAIWGTYTQKARLSRRTVHWYRKAADQGSVKGEDGLGYAYYYGYGVRRDYAEAARWYRKSAKQGDEYARRSRVHEHWLRPGKQNHTRSRDFWMYCAVADETTTKINPCRTTWAVICCIG